MGAADRPRRQERPATLGDTAAGETALTAPEADLSGTQSPPGSGHSTEGRAGGPPAEAGEGGWRRALLATLGFDALARPAGAHPRDQARDRPWRRAGLAGLGVFTASKVGLAAVSASAWIGDQGPGRSMRQVARLWATQYDSPWFTAIAEHGYQRAADASPAAFFPLYPVMIRLVTPLCLGRPWAAALLVANTALLAALVLLFRLAEHELDRAAAGRTVFYLVAFPTGFFLSAAYNEGLFIALLVAAVYCLRREHWWRAGALGALAATARSAGILLVLAFAFEYARTHDLLRPRAWFRSQSYFRTRAYVRARHLVNRPSYVGTHAVRAWQKMLINPLFAAIGVTRKSGPIDRDRESGPIDRNRKTRADWPANAHRRAQAAGGHPAEPGPRQRRAPGAEPGRRVRRPGGHWGALAILLIPAGLGAVMAADWFAYRDPLAFSHTQATHWGRHPAWPWRAPIDAARHPGPWFTEVWAHNLLELATVVLLGVLLVLALAGPWRLRRDQMLFPLLGAALLVFMISFPSRYTHDIPYPLLSTSRIGLEIFPAFLMLGKIGGRPWLDRALLAAFLGTQGVLAAHFLHSGWVA
ncbi:mannosyltransferase family protein [Dactylosporangium sp. NPDC051485]|uniref:mannosyltransferase family protein n=1 Tax=Dactylosporangium sp. NPDC051485 TaxID=3154846 RepID=UPI003444DFC7